MHGPDRHRPRERRPTHDRHLAGPTDQRLTDDGCALNGFDNFDRIAFWKTPIGKCATQDTCVRYSRWASDYIAIVGGQ